MTLAWFLACGGLVPVTMEGFLALGPGVAFLALEPKTWSHEQQVKRSFYSEDNFCPLWGLYG